MTASSHDSAHSAKREAILAAALDLFAERGFHGTSVPSVAEAAGVGAGTIYRYFASKEALVNALYQHWKGILTESVLSNFPFSSPPREQFHTFWKRLADWVIAQPKVFAFLEYHHHGTYLDDDSRAIESRVVGFAVAFAQQTTAQKITKALSPQLLIAIVWGAFVGMVRASWEGRLVLDADTVDAAEQCAWEAIRL